MWLIWPIEIDGTLSIEHWSSFQKELRIGKKGSQTSLYVHFVLNANITFEMKILING